MLWVGFPQTHINFTTLVRPPRPWPVGHLSMTPENPLNTAPVPTATPSILVVDDQLHHLRMLTHILQKGGYHVQRARDGTSALALAQAQPPALVLVDVMLPDMDGYVLCQQLKADPRTGQASIIFLSSPEPAADAARGLAAGGVDYLSKPWHEAEVLARVRAHLGQLGPVTLATHASSTSGRAPLTGKVLRVFIIEPHALLRRALTTLLTNDQYRLAVVGTAITCTAALQEVKRLQPDLLVVGWPLPAPESVTEVMAISTLAPTRPVLVLAANMGDLALLRLVQLGVAGCLPNETEPEALMEALHSLYHGALILPPTLTQQFLAETGPRAPTPQLTKRERDIVRGVAQGLSNSQIAKQLALSPATIRTHVSRLLHKLGLANRTQLALYAHENGHLM